MSSTRHHVSGAESRHNASREGGGERGSTHTHTHTHTERERERERETLNRTQSVICRFITPATTSATSITQFTDRLDPSPLGKFPFYIAREKVDTRNIDNFHTLQNIAILQILDFIQFCPNVHNFATQPNVICLGHFVRVLSYNKAQIRVHIFNTE